MSKPDRPEINRFKESFREEGRDILVELESVLLALNENPSDVALVGRAFRGLHTIKGSGAMFGFEKLSAFTHDLETAFDLVRCGKLSVNSELIDLTLAALDQIRAMLEEREDTPLADSEACAQILGRVHELAGIQTRVGPGDAAPPAQENAAQDAGQNRQWRVRFSPGADLLQNGTNPFLLLRELRQLGGLSVQCDMSAIPPLRELDPERCYVAWEMVLSTSSGPEAIRDVFIFVEDRCELVIESVSNEPAQKAPGASRSSEDEPAEPRSPSGGRRAYDSPDNASSLRVPAAKLDQFVDLVGELVTVQARLGELAARRDDPEFAQVSEEVERLTSALRETSMNLRMMPVRGTFERFRRLVHDLARDLGKDVELTIEGAETELDKTVIEQLADPLMHLIRNSMDHGIELPQSRIELAKRRTASIHLAARHSGASVLIEVADDGAGIDAEAVRRRAIERGIIAPDAQLTEAEIYALLFRPGFSTAKQVTDLSGRGVGMDVVRQRVDALRGSIDVKSTKGRGTVITLRLPLTLAIIDGLLVRVDEAHYVLPLANTLECIELTRKDIENANGKHIVNVRGEIVPYIRLREHFNIGGARPAIEQIMIVETENGRVGFVVDQVLGNCQTVIKNLGRFYRHVQMISGATILGDGTVALILDPHRLVQYAVRAKGVRARGSSIAPGAPAARNGMAANAV